MDREAWSKLLRELLEEEVKQKGAPVPGARLRRLMEVGAASAGAEMPRGVSFLTFVLDVAPDVEVIRQKGSDVLFLPESRRDLLPEGHDLHLRKDLFEALTTINVNATPWYQRERDRVVWRSKDDVSPDGYVSFPSASFESEIELRREYATSLASADERVALEGALDGALPFRAFSRMVRQQRKLARWLAFRNQRLRARLEEWSRSNAVAWRDSWITQRGQSGVSAVASETTPEERDAMEAQLGSILTRLSADDMRRVHVPLDIVLRLLRER